MKAIKIFQNSGRFFLLFIIVLLISILWKGLTVNAQSVDPNINRDFPEFALKDIHESGKIINKSNLIDQVTIIHIWASWCSVCVSEQEQWIQLKNKWPFTLIGVIYRDEPNEVLNILKRHGADPYQFLLDDRTGKLGLALGIIGTPETFILDKKGVIQFHYLGAVDTKLFETKFLPVLQRLN